MIHSNVSGMEKRQENCFDLVDSNKYMLTEIDSSVCILIYRK